MRPLDVAGTKGWSVKDHVLPLKGILYTLVSNAIDLRTIILPEEARVAKPVKTSGTEG